MELVVVRDRQGQVFVYEDACPHKRVRLSQFGRRQGNTLVCGYHGWKFETNSGKCTEIPGMPALHTKFCLRSYPVKRYGGWVWAFPGDPELADQRPLPVIPPAHDRRYHPIPMEGAVNCHFSYMTENATDLFHADLHRSQQPWANPRLESLESDDRTVVARYEVDAPRLLAALIGQRGKNYIRITYEYPYFHLQSEDGAFYLFVTYVPTGAQSIWVHSTFYFRHVWGMPWILRLLHPLLDWGTFRQVFHQDIRAVEEEQRAYNLSGCDRSRETNPVSHAVRNVILHQCASGS
ncbi:MAG: Rieske 2Fe-2S domain-containing protein [Cyanobacteria bacterium]|nr:Rieske 2Fe-2S domain-containing protein [Cyanobacteriota bacterium]MDW8200438.1 Rieske 2Fe-2S domain-containing protein [Cyanobacteriota bacterium SKYGB_h_bin112]